MSVTALWSPEQHALMGAMGLRVYAHVDAQPWPAPVAVPVFENLDAPRASGAPSTPARRDSPAPVVESPRQQMTGMSPGSAPVSPASPSRRAPPVTPVDNVPEPTAVPPRGGRGRLLSAMPDRLMLAVLRASGLDPGLAETQARMASWPLDTLRKEPAAKRALWSELRRERKQRQGR